MYTFTAFLQCHLTDLAKATYSFHTFLPNHSQENYVFVTLNGPSHAHIHKTETGTQLFGN